MEMVVVTGICAAAAAFLVYFEVKLFRDSSRLFAIYHVECRLASRETPPETDDELAGEPLADAAAA